MQRTSFLIIFTLFLIAQPELRANGSTYSVDKGSKIQWVDIDLLSPTQFNIGHVAMLDKKQKMLKKFNKELKGKKKLEKYLLEKAAPAYLASNGRYYIVDRHHTSRALYEANTSIKKYPILLIQNLSHLSLRDFFKYLQKVNGLYLFDNGEGPLDPFELPLFLSDLDNDPYRSLSWMVREEDGYEKIDVNFQEFIWANFFRKNIPLYRGTETELKKNLKRAIEMALSPEASNLPGFKN